MKITAKEKQLVLKYRKAVAFIEVPQEMIDKIASMTKDNNHFGARMAIAELLGNKELGTIYKTLELLNNKYNSHYAVRISDEIEKRLYYLIQKKFSNWEEVKGAL